MTGTEADLTAEMPLAPEAAAIFDASPYPQLILSPDLVIVTANAAHAAMLDRPRDDYVGRYLFDAFPVNPDDPEADSRPAMIASAARVLDTGATDEMPLIHHDIALPDGTFAVGYWRAVNTPMRVEATGSISHILHTVRDVTTEVLATRRSDTQRQTLKSVRDVSFWQFDPATRLIDEDGALASMFGFVDPAEHGGRMEAFLERVHPEDADAIAAELEAQIGGPIGRDAQLEYRVARPDGSTGYLVVRSSTIPRAEGGRLMVGTTIDVTPLREHEAALAAALAQKEVLLDEMNHRVKNSLQLVASILKLTARAEANEDTRATLLVAVERVNAIAAVHGALYEGDDVRHVEIAPHLSAFCTALGRSAGAEDRGISIDVTAPADLSIPVNVAVPLSLIVNELVTNAFKHAFGNPDAVRGGWVEVRLTREAASSAMRLVVANGPGPDPVSAATPDPTGRLGSKLVATLARQIGARITETRSPGWTTTLEFTLPDD